ncbi:hypothetical protein RI129_003179 [Pyrocoelia pectoralis]|uniref:Uncharacterized protein n=1 Tax=Pyrocoelia pectoralis TaxID=417401 RepID=A0AAN7ZMM1_9COLE
MAVLCHKFLFNSDHYYVHRRSKKDRHTSRGALETPEKKTKSRWRQQNIEARKKVKAKKRRNLGHSYENSSGESVEAKTLGPPCRCKNKCRSLLSQNENIIFNSFWDLNSYDKQNAYLFGTIRGIPKKRSYPKKTKRETSSRTVTFLYSVKVDGVDTQICKEEFLSVHGLQNCKKSIYNICKQIRQGNTIPTCDGRGKHHNRKNRLPDDMLKSVHDHINAIPKYTSHYSRKHNPNRLYIDHDLSISSLYKKYYKPWCEDQGFLPVKEDAYRRIFCNHYNIGFKLPKSDTCETCDKYSVLLDSNKNDTTKFRELQIQLELHQRKAEAMQTNMKTEIKLGVENVEIDADENNDNIEHLDDEIDVL